MKKILKYIVVGGSLFLIGKKYALASSNFILENDPNALTYKIETEQKTKQLYFLLVKDKQTQELVYCLEPGVNLSDETYEELKEWEYQKLNLSKEQKDYIAKVAYYGYGYPTHEHINYYYAAQLLIWEKIIPESWRIYFTNSLGGQKVEWFMKERGDILKKITEDDTLPSFANQTFTWNDIESLKLVDQWNQLPNYHLITETPWKIFQSQNQLTIINTTKETETLKFVKNYLGEPLKFYVREDGQNILKRGKLESKEWYLTMTPYQLEIKIKKVDEEDKPIKDVVFELITKEEIKNAQNKQIFKKNEVVKTLKTDEQGNASEIGFIEGSYCLKEKETPNKYQKEEQPICFELTKENPIKTFTIMNKKKRGTLIILKQDKITEEPIEGVLFKITDEEGKIVYQGSTDQEGKIEIKNLPLGIYQIVEQKSQEGYMREPIPTTIELKDSETETKIVLKNQKITQKLILQKEDAETKERLKGVEFLITNQEGKKIFQGKTNEEGIIELENLEYGKYKITEIESIEGYVLEKNPIWFEIDGVEKEKIITLTNHKIKSVPETFEKSLFPKIEFVPIQRRRKK